MSSSSSKKTESSTTQTSGTQSGTASGSSLGVSGTVAPSWLTSTWQDYLTKAQQLAGVDPSTTVAGLNGTQTGAITAAGQLGDTSGGLFGTAAGLAAAGASGGANTIAGVNLGPAAQYGGTAAVTPTTYGGTTVGDATHAAAPTIDPTTHAAGSTIAPTTQVQGQSLLDNLSSYMNPYIGDVVDTTLQGFDKNAGAQQAALAAKQAASGAFGGSRAGLEAASLLSDQGQTRAATEAQLRSDAFNTGAALSGQDADRRQSAATTNANADNARATAQAGLDQSTGQFNASADNTRSIQAAQLAQQLGLFNAGADNDNTALKAQLAQSTGLFNAGATNDAAEANANRDQQTGLANTAAVNDRTQAQGSMDLATQTTNAGEQDQNLARILQASGLFGNLGTAAGEDQRANIGTQLTAGGVQQQTEQAQKDAATKYLSQIAGLFGQLPTDLFTQKYQAGQTNSATSTNTSGTSSSNGTSTTTSNGSLLDTLSTLAKTASTVAAL